MLTKEHVENFNDQYMRIYIPTFAANSPEFDKVWLVFLWMVGQQYGFKNAYHFHHGDYKLLTGTSNGRASDDLCHEFNERHGEYVKLGYLSNHWNVAYFKSTDWVFAPYDLADPRMQRAFIHLYNAVWKGNELSTQLFEPDDYRRQGIQYAKSSDTGWFQATSSFQTRTVERKVPLPDQPPHYLAEQQNTYRLGHIFAGTIHPQKIITNG
jgi:hypothetical protein